MSKNKDTGREIYDGSVEVVQRPNDLPYAYIPYSSFESARAKHPNDILYVYEGKLPGYRIVAFPILMEKPEKEA